MSSSDRRWSIKELVELLKQVAEIDKDNITCLSGGAGMGKSTLGILMCKTACPWFDLNNDIIFSRKELLDWINNARPGSWGLADEAINVLFKRDFAAKQQKFLLKIIDMCREKNLTLLMCVPNFWAMDKHLLEGRVRLRVHVAKTGLAFMWKPSENPFTPDKWCRKYNEKVCYNWDSYPNAKRTIGFMGFLPFGDLPEKYKVIYLKIKKEKKEMIAREEEEENKKEELVKKRSIDLGKLMILVWLDKRSYLKNGWLTNMALDEGITKQALKQKIQIFADKYGDLIGSKEDVVGKVNTVNNNIVYINSSKSNEIEETSVQFDKTKELLNPEQEDDEETN